MRESGVGLCPVVQAGTLYNGGLIGLQGIGYFYLGKIGKGIGYLVGSLALFIAAIVLITIPSPFMGIGAVCLVVYICMFVWQILDSWRLCRQYNDYYEEFGGY